MPNLSAADILSRLIRFDTVSDRSNLPLLDWVEERLAEHGVAARRVFDETGEKANLIASVGPEDASGYLLSGHTDVVPVEGQEWTRDPFGGEIAGGRVWGRGASDMKGFLACVLAAVPAMRAARLETPLHIVFSHDEEIGCVGVRSAIAEIAAWPAPPRGCFVGEPTGMGVVTGHKAKRSARARLTGRTGHSSRAPEGVNAAEYAARLAAFVSDLGRRLAGEGARDPLYDVPHTTAHVGVLRGGTQLNIVPDAAEVQFEIRAISADDPDALVAEVEQFAARALTPAMRAIDPAAGVAFEPISEIPGLETAENAEIVTLAKRLAGRDDHARVAFGTEGGLFQQIGAPTVVIGPGDIGRAHKADEYVEIAELDVCSAFLDRLIAHCAA